MGSMPPSLLRKPDYRPLSPRLELLYANLRRMDAYLARELNEPWRLQQVWFVGYPPEPARPLPPDYLYGRPALDYWLRI